MSGETTNYADPMLDPVNAALMRLLASRLSAGYAVVGKQVEADRWCRVAMAATGAPPAMADV